MNLEYPWDNQKIKFKNIAVYRSKEKDRYILIGHHNLTSEFAVLHLHILKGSDLYQKDLKNYVTQEDKTFQLEEIKQYLNKYNPTLLYNIRGIFGFIKLLQGYYVIFVKEKKYIAKLGKHKIFSIEETCIVELFDGQYSQAENKYKNLLKEYDLDIGFYSSYTYDVTNPLSKNIMRQKAENISNTKQQKQTIHRIDQYRNLFMWNHYVMTEFDQTIKDKRWILPIIHGYCEQSTIKQGNNFFSVTLIARRSIKHAGARYLTRGINEQGYVANFVETEQIVIDLDKSTGQIPVCSSFIQIRGSAPVYWYQEPKMYVAKPPIKIHQSDPYLLATKKHIYDLIQQYGRSIYMINLVKQNEHNKREQILAEEYCAAINCVKEELQNQHDIEIGYLHFDMKAQLKQGKEEFVKKCYKSAYYCINKTGVFLFQKDTKIQDSAIIELQNGVVRSNCIDCLDRTNTFQQLIGELALAIQLAKINQTSLRFNHLIINEQVLQEFREMYEQLGDFVSNQYGSSLAHKQNIGQNSKRFELIVSLKRHIRNNMTDQIKQNQIDLFLGIHKPNPDNPIIEQQSIITLYPEPKFLSLFINDRVKQWWVYAYQIFETKSLYDTLINTSKTIKVQQPKAKFREKRTQTGFDFEGFEKMIQKKTNQKSNKNTFQIEIHPAKLREQTSFNINKQFNIEEKLRKPYYDVIYIEKQKEKDNQEDQSQKQVSEQNSPMQTLLVKKVNFSLIQKDEQTDIEYYSKIKSLQALTDQAKYLILNNLNFQLSKEELQIQRKLFEKYVNGDIVDENPIIQKKSEVKKQNTDIKQSVIQSDTSTNQISILQTKKVSQEDKNSKLLTALLKKNISQNQKFKVQKI